jgi:HNH endonuclease
MIAINLDRAVRNRAKDACEYCQMPQSARRLTFQIDHIVARQHRGPTTMENLALA